MTPKVPVRSVVPRDRWDAQIAALDGSAPARPRREPLSAPRIVAAALALVETEGYAALTMRRVATALQATPGALYVHVRDKAELDDLMIGELCSRVRLPEPDPTRWMAQAVDVIRQLRDQYLRYPGISAAALAAPPQSLDTLRINEGLLAILLAGGVALTAAAWAADAAYLYAGAYSIVSLRRHNGDDGAADRADVLERFAMLPPNLFPISHAHGEELMSGEAHERFDFTLELLFGGIAPRTDVGRQERNTP